MEIKNFSQWLAEFLNAPQTEIDSLLLNQTALQFLVTWSIFEAKCFDGYLTRDKIEEFAQQISESTPFPVTNINFIAAHFHDRYQKKELRRKLLHQDKSKKFSEIIERNFDNISSTELIFLSVFIVYRFRNNIFHGNKHFQKWTNYEKQIDYCIFLMQKLISHSKFIQKK